MAQTPALIRRKISLEGTHPENTRDPKSIKDRDKKMAFTSMMSSIKLLVLCLLCMQNTLFTVLRRYSQGVLKENYSKVSHIIARSVV